MTNAEPAEKNSRPMGLIVAVIVASLIAIGAIIYGINQNQAATLQASRAEMAEATAEAERELVAAAQAEVEAAQAEVEAVQATAEAVQAAAAAQQAEALGSQEEAALAAQAEAETQGRLAESRRLAAAAGDNLPLNPERALLLALQAVSTTYSVDNSATEAAEEVLHRAIQADRVEAQLTGGHTAAVNDVAYSPTVICWRRREMIKLSKSGRWPQAGRYRRSPAIPAKFIVSTLALTEPAWRRPVSIKQPEYGRWSQVKNSSL
jgi:hypothetical protein